MTAYEMRISDWSSDVCTSDLKATVGSRHCVCCKPQHWRLAHPCTRSSLSFPKSTPPNQSRKSAVWFSMTKKKPYSGWNKSTSGWMDEALDRKRVGGGKRVAVRGRSRWSPDHETKKLNSKLKVDE